MPNLDVSGAYVGVRDLCTAANIRSTSVATDAAILEHLLAASRDVEQQLRRRFFPVLATNYYDWPPAFSQTSGYIDSQPLYVSGSDYYRWLQFDPMTSWWWRLTLNDDLLSVSNVQVAATGLNTVPVTITHYLLGPQAGGPPYNRLEIDLSNTDVLQAGTTPQRSVAITGQWGYSNTTVSAGTLAAALNSTSATTSLCSDASRIDQGDVILIDTEAIYVDTPRTTVDTTATLSAGMDSAMTTRTVPLSDGTQVHTGEVILIDSESMLVSAIVGNNATVTRAWDGSSAAAHSSGAHVYAARGLTIRRGVNGTAPATHLINAPISRYQAPASIRRLVRADAVVSFQQDLANWAWAVGSHDLQAEFQAKALDALRQRVTDEFSRRKRQVVFA